MTATRFDPARPGHVAIGTRSGRVLLWTAGGQGPAELGAVEGQVNALCFTPDGGRLAAAGAQDRSPVVWALGDPPRRLALTASLGHTEQVRSLEALSRGLIASGSDDATVRLWDPAGPDLLGVLSALPRTSDWVAYAPDGLFDGSERGRRRVTCWFGDARDGIVVDRFYKNFVRYGLIAELARGERPAAQLDLGRVGDRRPPSIRILSTATSTVKPFNRATVEVAVTDRDGGVGEVLCFQGLPGDRSKHWMPAGPLRVEGPTVRVSFVGYLVEGPNPLWLSCTDREGVWECEPVPITLTYDQPKLPGSRLFVASVGVARYQAPELDTLKFASRDAISVHDMFARRRSNALYQEVHVEPPLLDQTATRAAILDQVRSLAARTDVQDTLVVFLSGPASPLVAGSTSCQTTSRSHTGRAATWTGSTGSRGSRPTTCCRFSARPRPVTAC